MTPPRRNEAALMYEPTPYSGEDTLLKHVRFLNIGLDFTHHIW